MAGYHPPKGVARGPTITWDLHVKITMCNRVRASLRSLATQVRGLALRRLAHNAVCLPVLTYSTLWLLHTHKQVEAASKQATNCQIRAFRSCQWEPQAPCAESSPMLVLAYTSKMGAESMKKTQEATPLREKSTLYIVIMSVPRLYNNKIAYRHTGRPHAGCHDYQTRPRVATPSQLHRQCVAKPPHHRCIHSGAARRHYSAHCLRTPRGGIALHRACSGLALRVSRHRVP
jgi:hypothetical protein